VVLGSAAVAACGGGSSSSSTTVAGPSSSTSSSSSTTSTTAGPPATGPATARLALAGDAALTGSLTQPSVSCSFPGFDGLSITVLAQTIAPNVSTFIIVTGATVHVRVASGSGKTYLERAFDGTGVSGYDPARGARLDTKLTESVASKGAHAGTLPAATSLNGDISCGAQKPGSSTLVLSGETGGGALTGTPDPVRVSCFTTASGKGASVVGIVNVGSKRALAFISGQPDSFTVLLETKGATTTRFFRGQGAGISTPTAQGVHISGDAHEQNVAGGVAHTLHVAGDAVCGSTVGH
jgi:hypothetical protein